MTARNTYSLILRLASIFVILLLYVRPGLSQDLIPHGLIQLGNGSFYSPYAFVVDKKERKLTVWKQDGLQITKVAEYPTDMGKNEGDKTQLGDHKTPEGIYFLETMIEGAALPFDEYGVRAFTMNYPNLFDQRAKKTGSGIWLHAIPETKTLERGSRGCVVVRNDVILELSKYITLEKTPILIYDSVQYSSLQDRSKNMKDIESLLSSWITSWKNKDISAYMSNYATSFSSNNMNFKKWQNYKKGLAEQYTEIDIQLFSPVIYAHKKGWVIRSLQSYRSDKYEDFGEKTLYLQPEGDSIKIVGEDWKPVERTEATQNLARCCTPASSDAQAKN